MFLLINQKYEKKLFSLNIKIYLILQFLTKHQMTFISYFLKYEKYKRTLLVSEKILLLSLSQI